MQEVLEEIGLTDHLQETNEGGIRLRPWNGLKVTK